MKAPRDDGFTLVELLVVVAILGIIGPVMGAAFVEGYRTFGAASTQLAASHNRQLLAAFFTEDAQSAATAEDATSNDTTTCMLPGEALVGRLSWSDRDATGTSTPRVVTYVTVTANGESQLVRHSCTGSARTDVVLVHGVVGSTLTCLSTVYTATSCSTFGVLRLTATDAAGSFAVTGLKRS